LPRIPWACRSFRTCSQIAFLGIGHWLSDMGQLAELAVFLVLGAWVYLDSRKEGAAPA
jgi:hypothetical protein